MKEMIDRIYEVIADKTLSFGCKINTKFDNVCVVCDEMHYIGRKIHGVDGVIGIAPNIENQIKDVIGHPVMIGDVLDWIDHTCNWINNGDGSKSRDIEKHRDLIVQIYYYFINGLNKPIEYQSEDAILFIYNLINEQ